jgi:transcriptional regulator with XRE-family HTH domain
MATPPGEAELRKRLARATKRERLRLGLTQEQAAELAGIATRQLQRLEAGTVNAGLSTLSGLCRAFRVDVRRLFEL